MRGIGGRDTAQRLGVSDSTVRSWRSGKRAPAPWVRRAVVALEQARRRARGPAWVVGYSADTVEGTRKLVVHLGLPGFIHDGRKIVAWLDDPRHTGKRKIRLLIAKARTMATSEVW